MLKKILPIPPTPKGGASLGVLVIATGSQASGINGKHRHRLTMYLLAFAGISISIYYLPDYRPLEEVTARYSAGILEWLGYSTTSFNKGNTIFLDNFEIAKDCTGIQALAFLAGLVLPARGIHTLKKTLMLSTAATGLLVINSLRIALQVIAYRSGILEWAAAHDLLGRILSGFAIFLTIMIYTSLVPEFREFLLETFSGTGFRRLGSLLSDD